jgi:hypothetical protein
MEGRKALACLLVILSVQCAWGDTEIVGIVGISRAASLGRSPVLPGSTLFSGDAIEVGPQGIASIALAGSGSVYVAGDSKILLSKAGNRIQFELVRGTVAFRFPAKTLDARLADATIQAAGSGPASGILTMPNVRIARIAAQEGELLLTTSHDANGVTLHAGEALELALVPEAPNAPSTAARKTFPVRVLIVGSIGAGIVTAVALALNRHQKLSSQEVAREISPFRFP